MNARGVAAASAGAGPQAASAVAGVGPPAAASNTASATTYAASSNGSATTTTSRHQMHLHHQQLAHLQHQFQRHHDHEPGLQHLARQRLQLPPAPQAAPPPPPPPPAPVRLQEDQQQQHYQAALHQRHQQYYAPSGACRQTPAGGNPSASLQQQQSMHSQQAQQQVHPHQLIYSQHHLAHHQNPHSQHQHLRHHHHNHHYQNHNNSAAVAQQQQQQHLLPVAEHQRDFVDHPEASGHLQQASDSIAPAINSQPQQQQQQEHFTEEVIQAILAAKEALEKPIEERDERDIQFIDNLCSLIKGFDVFPKSVRRALAAQVVLIVIDEEGKELIVHNEELDSFCVLIFGRCEQLNASKTVTLRHYNVGDSFGVCKPTSKTVRFVGHMITRCENCAFLCVKRDDFYRILTDSANYPTKQVLRHKDKKGNVVCVSQFDPKKQQLVTDEIWSHHIQSTDSFTIVLPDNHVIIKASEDCLLFALVDGYDRIDNDFVDDFLLLFRVFMAYDQKDKEKRLPPGMIKLCLYLASWLEFPELGDKVVKIILTWLSSYNSDFELNPDFSYLYFKVIESKLLKLRMSNQLQLLHATLSTKSKTRVVTLSRSSREQPLPFSISGGYEKNCGVFVSQVYGSGHENCPYKSLMSYLDNSAHPHDKSGLTVQPRRSNQNMLSNVDSKGTILLRPGDQILEVNGTNFNAIKLSEAKKKLDMTTHLSLTLKYNPSAFHEMRALPEGKRKTSSISSISSISPYQTSNPQNNFNFIDSNTKQNDIPSSPLFSTNVNFGFKSIIPKGDRSSRLSSLKQFVKQIRDSTVQSSANYLETMSKISDNTSDDQSNDIELGKAKSNPDLANLRSKDKHLESGLANIISSDDLNPTSITKSSNNPNQTLVNVIRVFNAANNDSKYLLIHEETTAREVIMVAVKEFNLTGSHQPIGEKTVSSLNWHLYEVSVVPESKTIKQKCLSEQTSHLAERASLCARFYIKNNTQNSFGPARLEMGDDALVNEILKESPANTSLTSLNATLLAVELTLSDFNKFRSIEPQQFVYDTFFDCSEEQDTRQPNGSISSYDSTSLRSSSSDGQENDLLHSLNKSRRIPKSWMQDYQKFADISNKEMFWVVCEILSEKNISRRVKILKQFVRVADVCSQLRNYNSMFAIISGLGHSCVSRLKRTFEKLKPKYKTQLEKMRGLFDPSKNMSNYRICLSQTPPPAIPLFPQIKKDLTFTKEGRSIFVREPNDSSDDEDSLNPYNSQDTVRRKDRATGLHVKTNINQMTSGNQSFSNNSIANRTSKHDSSNETNLVNFSEIRQFTERIRNVIYFSSTPYSNDLLTNTRDSQRNQTQIKKMHEEWQMRKRIRHYIEQTLNSAIETSSKTNDKGFDQTDSNHALRQGSEGRLSISYDERTLYQRSLDIEPEFNNRPALTSSNSTTTIERAPPPPPLPVQLITSILPQVAPTTIQPQPPLGSNSSPTQSKSSSLSSCSSFNQHLPNYHHVSRSNLTSSVGRFGTESTESLRKLQALSETADDWNSYSTNNTDSNINNGLTRLQIRENHRSKAFVPNRIFPPKSSR